MLICLSNSQDDESMIM